VVFGRGKTDFCELGVPQGDVGMRKAEMNAVDVDVGLRAKVFYKFPVRDRSLSRLHISPRCAVGRCMHTPC
jgi:hypothetical protein